ncbi:MAG: DUF2161 family putative PD-(D/E)XK-type phosphodiesterase [Defluviitaleaceae bacterium]|nr:DUF2161 family putative PD-(D/E)XK-type phosphodiesterase [Defluviitaleaceae bacterium]
MSATYRETDMYAPVKAHLESMGFAVSAEVRKCDVVATSGDQVVIVELKRSFVLRLVYQGLARQALTSLTFLCVPRPRSARSASYKNMVRLVRRLGLGLMFVAMDSPRRHVEVAVLPDYHGRTNSAALSKLLGEVSGRKAGENVGGSIRTKLNTAYRERAIRIACAIEAFGELSAKRLVHTYGSEKDAHSIMYVNAYGWFERTRKGVYGLSQAGREFLDADKLFAEVIMYYREHFKNIASP